MSELYHDIKSPRQPYTELFVALPSIRSYINLSLSNYTRLPRTSFVVVGYYYLLLTTVEEYLFRIK
jgi:hypothetical protein